MKGLQETGNLKRLIVVNTTIVLLVKVFSLPFLDLPQINKALVVRANQCNFAFYFQFRNCSSDPAAE